MKEEKKGILEKVTDLVVLNEFSLAMNVAKLGRSIEDTNKIEYLIDLDL